MALFGSPLEKDIKKASAETELAWAVVNQTDEAHLFIWRIVKFVPTPWPAEDYGKFYTGDSYIILNKYKKEGEEDWEYDLHFWIGSKSSQDEYGTAAYKTVELDTFLDDKAVQRREVEGRESDLFSSYFEEISLMEGGADSGFKHVTPETYTPRLIRIYGVRKRVVAQEVLFTRKSLNSVDVFVIDFGDKLYQFNGKDCNKDEKMKAMQFVQKLRDEHGGAKLEVVEEEGSTEKEKDTFLALLPDEEIELDTEEDKVDGAHVKQLWRLSDESGKLKCTKVAEGNLNRGMLDSKDVFFIDDGETLIVWVGRNASKNELRSGMMLGHNYLTKQKNPIRPLRRVLEGREDKEFYDTIY